MKKIAVLCAVCMLFTGIFVFADSDISVLVSDIQNNIVTVSGSAPNDTVVAIMLIKPGKTLSDVESEKNINAVAFLGGVYSSDGMFSCDIKMNTECEGAFTVLVSFDGVPKYENNNFIFYSNETKMGYIEDVKYSSKNEIEEKVSEIYSAYSISDNEAYKASSEGEIAKAICAQETRVDIETVEDASDFLIKAAVLSAFENHPETTYIGLEFKYADIWAKGKTLYSDNFINDLTDEGKKKVISDVTGANYSGAQFGDIYTNFEKSMCYNLIKNNQLLGAQFIEELVLTELNAEYEAAGFDTALLKAIKSASTKNKKLDEFLSTNAGSLTELAKNFNKIFAKSSTPTDGGSGGGGGASSGGGGGSAPAVGGGLVEATPAPEDKPQEDVTPVTHQFKDIEDAPWADEAIKYLYEKKIINGRSETSFAPNDLVTRAELVKMICVALGVSDTTEKAEFADVENEWFAPYVKNAAAAGIVNGDGGYFKPNDAISRQDAALILCRALGLEKGNEIKFDDADDISDYAKEAVAAMVEKGYINGMGDGRFAPKNTLTRAQAAQLIYNALMKGGN